MMQEGIRKALAEDDAIPPGHAKPYGVREFPDWREHSDAIEAELDKRKETYTPVPW